VCLLSQVSHTLSIVFKFIFRITLMHVYIRHFVYALSYITVVVGYIRVGPEFTALLTFTRCFLTRAFHPGVAYMLYPLPAVSAQDSLHAASITCALQTPIKCRAYSKETFGLHRWRFPFPFPFSHISLPYLPLPLEVGPLKSFPSFTSPFPSFSPSFPIPPSHSLPSHSLPSPSLNGPN